MTVSNNEFVVYGKHYPLSNITSYEMITRPYDGKPLWGVLLALLCVLYLILLFTGVLLNHNYFNYPFWDNAGKFTGVPLVIALIITFFLSDHIVETNYVYHLNINTSGSELSALISDDERFVLDVKDALTKAIENNAS